MEAEEATSGPDVGVIVGATLGGVAGLVLLIVLYCCLIRPYFYNKSLLMRTLHGGKAKAQLESTAQVEVKTAV